LAPGTGAPLVFGGRDFVRGGGGGTGGLLKVGVAKESSELQIIKGGGKTGIVSSLGKKEW